jgi:hypothetical protein
MGQEALANDLSDERPSSITESIKPYFSLVHIESAARRAREAGALEGKGSDASQEDFDLIQECAVNAMVSSVAFLEATVNEFFFDVSDFMADHLLPMTRSTRTALKALWAQETTEKLRILDKYCLAVDTLGRRPDRGREPWQSARLLIDFRNYLLHYKATWVRLSPRQEDEAKLHKLAKALRGRFLPSTILTDPKH